MSITVDGYAVYVIDEVLNYGGFFGGTTVTLYAHPPDGEPYLSVVREGTIILTPRRSAPVPPTPIVPPAIEQAAPRP